MTFQSLAFENLRLTEVFKVNFSRELVMVRPSNHDLPIKHLREPQADRIVLLLAQIVQARKFPTEPRYGTHIKKADHL
jgi:hypothetical protein